MRTVFVCLLSLATMLAAERALATIETLTSAEGHRFHFYPVPEADRAAFQLAWTTDWPHRPELNPNVPDIGTDLMLVGSAGEMEPAEVLEEFNDLQAEGYLFHTADHVRGLLVTPKETMPEAIDIAHAVLTEPGLEADWMNRIKDRLIANQTEAAATSNAMAANTLYHAILGGQPLQAFLSLSDPAPIEAVSVEDIRAWHGRTFITDGLEIVVAGPLSEAEAGLQVDRLLAGLPSGNAAPPAAVTADFRPRTILLHRPDAETSTLAFVGQLPSTREGGDSHDLFAILALGQGENSALFEAVRTELRAAYDFGATLANYNRDIRLVAMGGEVETEKLQDVRDVVVETYAQFREEGAPDAVTALKPLLRDETEANLEQAEPASNMILETVLDGFPPERAVALPGIIGSTTHEAVIQRLQSSFPAAEELIIVAVSPDRTALPEACVISTPEDVPNCP